MPIMPSVSLESIAPTVFTPSIFLISSDTASVTSDVSSRVLSSGICSVADICGVLMDGIYENPLENVRAVEATSITTEAMIRIFL